ncbi:MAG: GGDEF domain-containing protein [Peptococcaceae bacterium]|nr:GGDEF domain-containing protein [Peptococcaceae bacterium]
MKRMVAGWLSKFPVRRSIFPIDLSGSLHGSGAMSMLFKGHWVGMIYLDIVDFMLTEQAAGTPVCLSLLQSLEQLVRQEAPQHLKPHRLLEIHRWGDDLIIIFYSKADPPPTSSSLAGLALSLKDRLSRLLNQKYAHLVPCSINFHIGYTVIKPGQNPERRFYTAFKEVMMTAKSRLEAEEVERRQQFNDILEQKGIKIVYQPVVNLYSGEILGYEALSRGPEDTFFASPVNLFSYAQKTHQLFVLEKIAREKALVNLGELLKKTRLFININPQVVNDPSFRPDEIGEFLAGLGVCANQVVFEITERTSINNFSSFRKSLEQYRQHGFLIAIDDAGAGYSSLQAIAEIQPDFIKVDHSLVKDIDKTATKKKLLETFRIFAQKTNSQLIAEGIESENELACLKSMDISHGQGYFFAKPGFPPPEVDSLALTCLASLNTEPTKISTGRIIPVRNIAQAVQAVSVRALTRDVLDFFTANPKVEGIAVTDDEYPVGLVMRDKLFNQLGTQYGFAVYTERPISLVMDNQPLVVEDDTPVEVVSQAAMGRLDHKVYDSIIITKNRRYHSLVSVRSLLDVLTVMQLEVARFANPLTGLPGNIRIEEEISNRLGASQPFSVIYADLDHFKGFNDKYGYKRGDEAIKLTAGILTRMAREHGRQDDLVGHIGGDDFMVITVPDTAEVISRNVCNEFDRLIPELYDPVDRRRGSIYTLDRKGREVEVPIMSISLAVVDCLPGDCTSLKDLSRVTAELKNYAKTKSGSVYVKERRRRGAG